MPFWFNYQDVYCRFAVDLMLLLLHKGRSVFSHLSPCTFQVLSFQLSSRAALLLKEVGGRTRTAGDG